MSPIILLIASLAAPASPLPQPGVMQFGEFWIAGLTNNTPGFCKGTGTRENPFTGDFDVAITRTQPFSLIHLGAGTNWTRGDAMVFYARGQRLVGAGKDISVIKITNQGLKRDLCAINSYADDVEISDLTIDCDYPGNDFKSDAIFLGGTHCAVRRVHVVHDGGNWYEGHESFPVFVGNFGNRDWSMSVIEDCDITDVRGDYTTGFCMNCNGVIVRCRAIFPALHNNNHPPFFNGYQFSQCSGATVRDCVQVGGTGLFYTDTGGTTNSSLINNVGVGLQQGIVFAPTGDGVNGVQISGNKLQMATNAIWGIILSQARYVYNANITDNSITGGAPDMEAVGVHADLTNNVHAVNNVWVGSALPIEPVR